MKLVSAGSPNSLPNICVLRLIYSEYYVQNKLEMRAQKQADILVKSLLLFFRIWKNSV